MRRSVIKKLSEFFRKEKNFVDVSTLEIPKPSKVDLTRISLNGQMKLIRRWENAVWHMFKTGSIIETTEEIPFMFCSGPDSYFDEQTLPAGTKFVVKSAPMDNENGTYDCLVLVNGREALVDVYRFYAAAHQL